MNQQAIFSPMFATVGLTLVVWIYMYARRLPFILSNDFSPEQLTPIEFAKLSPPAVANPSDNLKNLFEIPVLFYVLALYLFATAQVDSLYMGAAWIFVGFRVLHSIVHCTVNVITVRFVFYLLSTLAVWFMVGRAAMDYFLG